MIRCVFAFLVCLYATAASAQTLTAVEAPGGATATYLAGLSQHGDYAAGLLWLVFGGCVSPGAVDAVFAE